MKAAVKDTVFNAIKRAVAGLLSIAVGYWAYGAITLFAPKTNIVFFSLASLDHAIAVISAIVVAMAFNGLAARRFRRKALAEADEGSPTQAPTQGKPLPQIPSITPARSFTQGGSSAQGQPKKVYKCSCGNLFTEPIEYEDFVTGKTCQACPVCYTPQPQREIGSIANKPNAPATASETAAAPQLLPATTDQAPGPQLNPEPMQEQKQDLPPPPPLNEPEHKPELESKEEQKAEQQPEPGQKAETQGQAKNSPVIINVYTTGSAKVEGSR